MTNAGSALQEAIRLDSYDYYQEAIAWREQQKMPKVGISIDRRTIQHVSFGLQSYTPTSLVCSCCKCQHTCIDGLFSETARIDAGSYFERISAASFRANWSFVAYMDRYGHTGAMENHPELADNAWNFKRILKHQSFRDHLILCAPQDIVCSKNNHPTREIRACCLLPLCRICYSQTH